MSKTKLLFSLIAIPLLAFALAANSLAKEPPGIIHDAEHYILEAQHGEKWASEDKAIEPKAGRLEEEAWHPAQHHPYHVG